MRVDKEVFDKVLRVVFFITGIICIYVGIQGELTGSIIIGVCSILASILWALFTPRN